MIFTTSHKLQQRPIGTEDRFAPVAATSSSQDRFPEREQTRAASACKRGQRARSSFELGECVWKAGHLINGTPSAGCRFDTSEEKRGAGHANFTVHFEGRKAEIALGAPHQILDVPVIRRACEQLGLDGGELRGRRVGC